MEITQKQQELLGILSNLIRDLFKNNTLIPIKEVETKEEAHTLLSAMQILYPEIMAYQTSFKEEPRVPRITKEKIKIIKQYFEFYDYEQIFK